MPAFIIAMLFKVVVKTIRAFRCKVREAKPKPLCLGCIHSHVQYAANARIAISCAYGSAVRPMKLDVLYCTDYQARHTSPRTRVIGFVREITPAG